MTPTDIEQYNIFQLYRKLLQETTSKVLPIMGSLRASSRMEVSKGWVSCLIYVLENKSIELLDLLTKDEFSISDLKRFLDVSGIQEKIICTMGTIVPKDCEIFITPTLQEELIKLRELFKKVNQKTTQQFIEAMMFCLDRELRKLGIEVNSYFPNAESQEFIDLGKLISDLEVMARTGVSNSADLLVELRYCMATYPIEELHNGLSSAVDLFYDSKHLAIEIDESCAYHECKRLEYLSQGLDIPNIVIGGFCSADSILWSKDDSELSPLPLDKSHSFSHHSQVHVLLNSRERILAQYREEKRIYEGGNPRLDVESQSYKIPKSVTDKMKTLDESDPDPEIIEQVKQEAKNIAIRAIQFCSLSYHHPSFFFMTLGQKGYGNSHVTALKIVKHAGKSKIQFRDVNAGCFEFDSARKFIDWFSDFYLIMGYHFLLPEYEFSYPAPISYARGHEWVNGDRKNPSLQLAIRSRHYQNDFDATSGQMALNIYNSIPMPTRFERQQVLYLLMASSFILTDINLAQAKEYMLIAKSIIMRDPEPRSLMDRLFHISICQELAEISFREGDVEGGLENMQRVHELVRDEPRLPKSLLDKVIDIIRKCEDGDAESISSLKEDRDKIDNQLTVLNTFIQSKLKRKLYFATELPIRFMEFNLSRVLSASMEAQIIGRDLARLNDRRTFFQWLSTTPLATKQLEVDYRPIDELKPGDTRSKLLLSYT